MRIKGMRWGYDGDGVDGCGPHEGSFVVELHVEDGQGKERYVSYSRFQCFNQLRWSREPLFDLRMNFMLGTNFDRMEELTDEMMDYEGNEVDDETLADHPYRHVVRLLRIAMIRGIELYYGDARGELDDESAAAFAEPYVGRDVDVMDLPVVYADEDPEGFDDEGR